MTGKLPALAVGVSLLAAPALGQQQSAYSPLDANIAATHVWENGEKPDGSELFDPSLICRDMVRTYEDTPDTTFRFRACKDSDGVIRALGLIHTMDGLVTSYVGDVGPTGTPDICEKQYVDSPRKEMVLRAGCDLTHALGIQIILQEIISGKQP